MDYYFDTSALIELSKDADRERIVGVIWNGGRLLLSAINIAEFAQNSKTLVRTEQLSFLKRACKGIRPFALPNDLCLYESDAYMARQKQALLSIRDDQEGIWIALNQPEMIDEMSRQVIADQLVAQERWYKTVRKEFRKSIDTARDLRLPKSENLSSPLRWLRRYYDDPRFMQRFFSPIMEKCGYGSLCPARIKDTFERCETWKFYFGAIGLGLYFYGFPQEGYGFDRQAGSIDTQQAAYMACADIFVTNEKEKQQKIMKYLSKCSHTKKRVLAWTEFKSSIF